MIIKSPLVDSENIILIRKIVVKELIMQWKNSFGIDITNELKDHTVIGKYKRNVTQLHFFKPDNIDGSGSFYESLQKFDWYYMPNKWEHHITLKNLKPKSKILEVGCAEGAFLKLCNQLGHETTGVELNKNAVIKARQAGLVVFEKDLNQFAIEKENYFDCVCSFQVLEHIAKPNDFISSCIKLLKPGGKLIFCTPNANGLLATDFSLLDLPPHHMTRWNKQAFYSLEKLYPLKLKTVHFEPLAKYHWDWYLNILKNELLLFKILRKIFSKKFACIIYKKLFSFGLNKLVKGHTIYVDFYKL